MPNYIGNIQCDIVRGEPKFKAPELRIWQTPGLDGYSAQKLGLGKGDTTFTAVQYGKDLLAGTGVVHLPTWHNQLRALIGQVVTISNHEDTLATGQFIVDVGEPRRSRAHDLNGITARFELTIQTLTT